ncbi:hypothetical protein N7449_005242 [Penicillium cf. viridicatum]|uniref:Uncharacterized protein n=1 Tax=Penicillium cf. viridicatum TaxID=2972119 RepID=A0A9W9SYU0_9EURO|nr:hypothetical protein N7449_005242 [Penicillium cf. viridicatum]
MVRLLIYVNKGPTEAGSAPFLAQTNLAPFGKDFYVPNTPVVTDVPIIGETDGAEIFKYMGNLSCVWVELAGSFLT